MKLTALITALLTFIALPAAAATYKCNQNGSIVYSDKECGENATKLRTIPAGSPQNDQPDQPPKSELLLRAEEREAKEAYERRMLEIARQKQIAIGMEPEWVIESWGRPSKINKSLDALGTWEQWIYESRYKTQYVHFRNGRVVSAE